MAKKKDDSQVETYAGGLIEVGESGKYIFVRNGRRSRAFKTKTEIKRIFKPVDNEENKG